MASILIYSSPTTGHLLPLVPGLQALVAGGHNVHVRAGSGALELLHRAGIAASAHDPRIAATQVRSPTPRRSSDLLRRDLAELVTRGSLQRLDLLAALDEVQPDLLVVDAGAHGAATVAESSGLPWAMGLGLHLAAADGERPPHEFGIAPRRGLRGRLRRGAEWGLLTPGHSAAMLPGLNALRAESSLPALADAADYFLRADRLLGIADAATLATASALTDRPAGLELLSAGAAEPLACAIEALAIAPSTAARTRSTRFEDVPRIATEAARAAVRAAAVHDCGPARAHAEDREVVAA